MKDSFILYTEQKDVIDKLSDEQAGKLIKAIFEYVKTDEMPVIDELLDIVVIPFKQSIDRNEEKWNEIKQKRSEAGKIGAEIKKQKQAKEANANFAKSKQANQAVNVNDSVNDNVNVNAVVDNEITKCYEENIGLFTPATAEILLSYLDKLTPDMIKQAIKIASLRNKKNTKYIQRNFK